MTENGLARYEDPRPLAMEVRQAVVTNNINRLTPEQQVDFVYEVCRTLGLNPLTNPLQIMTLQGKTTLYATKDAAAQLRKRYGVSVRILEQKVMDGLFMVRVQASDKFGRTDEDMAAVPLGNKGEAAANSMMKAITKAKRRVTLSICGLGFLDESEVESAQAAIPTAFGGAASASLDDALRADHGVSGGDAVTTATKQDVFIAICNANGWEVNKSKETGALVRGEFDRIVGENGLDDSDYAGVLSVIHAESSGDSRC